MTHHGLLKSLCGSRKYPYTPHRRYWKFCSSGGRNGQTFIDKCEVELESLGVRVEGLNLHKNFSGQGFEWVFSATKQFVNVNTIFIMVVKIMVSFLKYLMSLLMLHWFKCFTFLNIPQLRLGNIWVIFLKYL